MKIIQSILTQNDCYKSNKSIKPTGLMLHSVGCTQPSASVFIKQWNKSGVQKCVHGFIEPNGDVYQCLPFTMKGWHGGGVSNNSYLGFEMTEPSSIKYSGGGTWTDLNPEATKKHVLGTYKTAVELFAYLCKELKLDPLEKNVIISHSEGYKLGIASGHSDVEHIWSKMGLSMNQFRQDVKNVIDEVQPEKFTLKDGYNKTRMFNSDIHIYKTNPLIEDIDVTLGVRAKLEPLSKIDDPNKKETAKINGGFFSPTTNTEHLGTLVDEGLYYRPNNPVYIDLLYFLDGHVEIKNLKDTKEIAFYQKKTKFIIGCGWSLIINGKIDIQGEQLFDHAKYRNPRTMLGQLLDKSWVLVVADGRNVNSKGLNCTQQAEVMKALKCEFAVSMDGGGSSELCVGDKIVNAPSDGAERKVGSCVFAYKK